MAQSVTVSPVVKGQVRGDIDRLLALAQQHRFEFRREMFVPSAVLEDRLLGLARYAQHALGGGGQQPLPQPFVQLVRRCSEGSQVAWPTIENGLNHLQAMFR